MRSFLLLWILASSCCSPGATFLVSNTLDSGPGSLRQAIRDANAAPGLDTITFKIPGSGVRSLSPVSPLPPIVDPVVLDGTTQPGYASSPLIELNGSAAGDSAGVLVLAGNCTIQALAINRFAGSGIQLEGAGTNTVRGCFLGTDSSGTLARPNGLEGIWILDSFGNSIGGTTDAARNVIAGNAEHGIYVQNGANNTIQGNYIGVSASGILPIGNGMNGVTVYDSPGNRVGGPWPGGRNVISGNRGSGVYLNGPAATGNWIQGNFIGTGRTGSGALSNAADGITLNGAGENLIGGTNSGEGNLLSANGKAGVFLNGPAAACNLLQGNLVGTDVSGVQALGNGFAGITLLSAISNSIGGNTRAAVNLISGNRQDGIYISTNSTWNTVSGNLIGTDLTGTNALGNLFNGITVASARSNTIGTSIAGGRNIVSGNAHYGLQFGPGAIGNAVRGNFVGPDRSGVRSLKNGLSGIRVESSANHFGGSDAGAGNVLSGNALDGLMLVGTAASNNLVQGNIAGLAADGYGPLPNGRAGIGISGAPGNTIGGTTPAARNVLSANADAGIYLVGASAVRNRILGNCIGTDQSGTLPLGNILEGIYLQGSASNTIGGDVPGSGNVISANHTRGVFFTNASANCIEGNHIGTTIDGSSPLGNTFHNLEFERGSNNNMVGGPSAARNLVAFAQGIYAGVRIRDGGVHNSVVGNLIFANGALGIDLGEVGITPNDECDMDVGANQLQNSPVLIQAVSGTQTGICGTFNSAPNQPYLLQFFACSACDNSGAGEGALYLGEVTLTLFSACTASFVVSLPVQVPVGYNVTATATDPMGNTSEFSACAVVSAIPTLQQSLISDHELLLSWTNNPSALVLKQTACLAPPVVWSDVPVSPVLMNGVNSVRLLLSTNGSSFFMLSFQ